MNYYDFSRTKAALRKKLRARLRQLKPLEKSAFSKSIATELANHEAVIVEESRLILLYAALPLEASASDLMQLRSRHRFGFPRVIPHTPRLECRLVSSEQDLAPGAFGILEPLPERCPLIEPESIDIAILPGCAFSATGQRLGQGGGYYDRLLALPNFQAITIGVCFECQFFDQLPTEDHDQTVDCVITEEGVRWHR